MNNQKKLHHGENQILTHYGMTKTLGGDGTTSGTIDGGTLPEVVVTGKAVHTGNISTCPICQQVIHPFFGGGIPDDASSGFLLGMQIMCAANKGKS